MTHTTATASRASSEGRRVALLVLGLTALLGIMLTAFALPAIHSGAKGDVPIGVVAAPSAADQLTQRLSGSFDVTVYPDAQAARQAILHRDSYGALVVTPGHLEVLVATAASTAVAQAITQMGTGVAAALHVSPSVTEVRGFPAGDPRGAGLSAGALPLALGGWIGAVLIMQLIASSRSRIVAVFAFAVVGGFALTAIIQFGFGTFDGNYLLTSLAAALGIAATAMGVLGLRELFGNIGLVIAAVALILLGNPLSGLTSAPEMLPAPWGFIGQLLPPGATGALLRDVALFDGWGATHGLIVLVCWLVVGLAFYALGLRRQASKDVEPSAQPVETAATVDAAH